MKMSAFFSATLSLIALLAAPVAKAATRPSLASVSVPSGERLGQSATTRVRRASAGSDSGSTLLGAPLFAVFLGAATVAVVTVTVAVTRGPATPQS